MSTAIDPNNPTGPDSFFHYYGSVGVAFSGYVALPGYTVEQFYQAIKARLIAEGIGVSALPLQLIHLADSVTLDGATAAAAAAVAVADDEADDDDSDESSETGPVRRRGRPKGAKNKPKDGSVETDEATPAEAPVISHPVEAATPEALVTIPPVEAATPEAPVISPPAESATPEVIAEEAATAPA